MKKEEFAALMAFDWADARHVGCLQETGSELVEDFKLEQKARAIDEWASDLRRRFKGRKIAVAIEQRRGPLVYALLKYEFLVIFPLNTTAAKHYRKAMRASGAKGDVSDARLQLGFLRKHLDELKRLEPDELTTRQLRMLVESRRKQVDAATGITNQITALLKQYYPTALEMVGTLKTDLACDFLSRWPSLNRLRRTKVKTLQAFYFKHNCRSRKLIDGRLNVFHQAVGLINEPEMEKTYAIILVSLVQQLKAILVSIGRIERAIETTFKNHEDHDLFRSFPAAGQAIAPRLAVVFGSDRNRYDDASAVLNFSGIAPVTISSGKMKVVAFRLAAPKFVRQSLIEFARLTVHASAWARSFYTQHRLKGKTHQATIRSLAYKWVRIMFRCWKNRMPYNEQLYLQALQKRHSPLLSMIQSA